MNSYTISVNPAGSVDNAPSTIVSIPEAAGPLIRELCGTYPMFWNGAKAYSLMPMLKDAIIQIEQRSWLYQYLCNDWVTIAETKHFLSNILLLCVTMPDGIVEVTL